MQQRRVEETVVADDAIARSPKETQNGSMMMSSSSPWVDFGERAMA